MENVLKFNRKSYKHDYIDKRKATGIINKLAEDGNNVKYSVHAKERLVERGFTYNDMLTILRDGVVREEPQYDEDKQSWTYSVDFIKFNGNRDARCVAAIQKKNKLFVITVMWIDL